MESQQQEHVRASAPLKGTSKQHKSKANLNDVTDIIKELAQSYDSEYTELCYVLEDVANDVDGIRQHRMTNVTALRDDIERLLNAVQTARKDVPDTTILAKHREEVHRLEHEKKQVVKDILNGKEEEKELRSKLRHVEEHIELTRQERNVFLDQTASELPSLEYFQKVLQRLSKTYLRNGHPQITEGFVCKKGTNDVRPFHFDESVSQFDKVNNLWKMISEE